MEGDKLGNPGFLSIVLLISVVAFVLWRISVGFGWTLEKKNTKNTEYSGIRIWQMVGNILRNRNSVTFSSFIFQSIRDSRVFLWLGIIISLILTVFRLFKPDSSYLDSLGFFLFCISLSLIFIAIGITIELISIKWKFKKYKDLPFLIKGKEFQYKNDLESAFWQYQKAVEINPSSHGYNALGELSALAEMKKIEPDKESSFHPWFDLISIEDSSKYNFTEAIDFFTNSLKSNPTEDAYKWVAKLKARMHDFGGAIANAKKAKVLHIENRDPRQYHDTPYDGYDLLYSCYYVRAEKKAKAGKIREAISDYENAYKNDHMNMYAPHRLAELYHSQQKYYEAAKWYAKSTLCYTKRQISNDSGRDYSNPQPYHKTLSLFKEAEEKMDRFLMLLDRSLITLPEFCERLINEWSKGYVFKQNLERLKSDIDAQQV